MTHGEAADLLTKLHDSVDVDRRPDASEMCDALMMAIALLRDREAHWQQQKELADKGGHGPGSDF